MVLINGIGLGIGYSLSATMANINDLYDIANKIRLYSLASTTKAGSGHPTSCFSIAEVMSVLFFHTLKQSKEFPKHPSSDRFILSKGHAAPVLYAAWTVAGLLTEEQNLSLRQNDSDIEGHPTPRLNFVDVATGSLGQGLSYACGMAYVGKYYDKASYRVYVVLGDGESAEGSNWEAMAFASHYKLDNLVLIIDVNRLGQSEPTQLQHDTETYRKRCDAFGFHTKVVDGHSVEELISIFDEAKTVKDKPTCVIAKTFKGHGSTKFSDKHGYHGKALKDDHSEIENEISARIKNKDLVNPKLIPFEDDAPKIELTNVALSSPPNYKMGDNAAVRKAYGVALVKLGDNSSLITTFDADTKNSTFAQTYKDKYPNRHVECFIAEQNMVGVAIGAACRDRRIAFVSTFACFLTRAFDQIRMGAISQTKVNFVGSHCGVSIGEDGPSQMGLEDLAIFRTVPECVVFYPSDAVSAERAIELAANYNGMTYTRTTRAEIPVIYNPDEVFEIGKGKVIRHSIDDRVTVIGGGITLFEANKAADILAAEGIRVRVIDLFTVKPIDKELLIENARATGGKVLTVEDHYPEGGIGEAVLSAISEETNIKVRMLAVKEVPRSGTPNALLDKYGISRNKIADAVRAWIQ